MRATLPLIISGTALIAASYGLARFGYGLFVPAFSTDFDLTSTVTGSISSGGFLAYCAAAAIALRLAESPRWNVLLAGLAATMGSIGIAVSISGGMLALSVLVAGAGAGFASPGTVALVERAVRGPVVDRMQAIVNSGTGFGVVLAGPLALAFSENWRTAWWLIAAVSAGSTISTLLATKSAAGSAGSSTGSAGAVARSGFDPGILKPLGFALVSALLAGASSAAVWTFGRSVVGTAGQLSSREATAFWILLGTAGVAGAFSGDLVTRWGLRSAWTATALAMALATGVTGAAPGFSPALYFAGALFGASYVALSGVLIAWASRALPGQASAGTAALFITLAGGQAGGAALVGFLLDIAPPVWAFCCAATISVLSLIPAFAGTSRPSSRRPVPEVLSTHD